VIYPVLWIEDDVRFGLAQLAGPLIMDGRFDLVTVSDVSAAVHALAQREFAAIVVDIRLPPGADAVWRTHYYREGSDKVHARLGIQLIRSLLGHPSAVVKLSQRPAWITAKHGGVFTVESGIQVAEDLKALDIGVYQQKRADLPDTALLDIVRAILARRGLVGAGGPGGGNPCIH
jgi:hypothetical protein